MSVSGLVPPVTAERQIELVKQLLCSQEMYLGRVNEIFLSRLGFNMATTDRGSVESHIKTHTGKG